MYADQIEKGMIVKASVEFEVATVGDTYIIAKNGQAFRTDAFEYELVREALPEFEPNTVYMYQNNTTGTQGFVHFDSDGYVARTPKSTHSVVQSFFGEALKNYTFIKVGTLGDTDSGTW